MKDFSPKILENTRKKNHNFYNDSLAKVINKRAHPEQVNQKSNKNILNKSYGILNKIIHGRYKEEKKGKLVNLFNIS